MIDGAWFNYFLAVVVPWCLGFAVVRGCLKQRYGYRWLAFGAGYWVGERLFALLIQGSATISAMAGYDFAQNELFAGGFIVAAVVFSTFRPHVCFIGEQRLEMATPLWQKLLMILLSALLALIFLTLLLSLRQSSTADISALLHYPALGCAVFGMLRYVQCERFIAFMGAFTLLSLPTLVAYVIREESVGYIASGAWTLLLFSSVANWIGYREYRQVLLVLLAGFALFTIAPLTPIASMSEHGVLAMIVSGVAVLMVILFTVSGRWLVVFMTMMFGLVYVSQELFDSTSVMNNAITQVHIMATDKLGTTDLLNALPISFDMRLREVIQSVFVHNHWHILFYALPLCLCLWLFYPTFNKGKTYRVAMIYTVSAWCVLFCTLTLVLLDTVRFPELGTALNQRLLMLAPLFALLPALTYEACRVKPRLG